MYENLTNPAREVLKDANLQAHQLNHEYVGTEHILLALIAPQDDNAAIKVLRSLGIDRTVVRSLVKRLIQTGPDQITMGEITRCELPMTPTAISVLRYAEVESHTLQHNFVGTGHILLGLLREDEGVAAQILEDLGLTLEATRKAAMPVSEVIGHSKNTGELPAETDAAAKPAKSVAIVSKDAELRKRLREMVFNLGYQVIEVEKTEDLEGLPPDFQFDMVIRLVEEAKRKKMSVAELMESLRKQGL